MEEMQCGTGDTYFQTGNAVRVMVILQVVALRSSPPSKTSTSPMGTHPNIFYTSYHYNNPKCEQKQKKP